MGGFHLLIITGICKGKIIVQARWYCTGNGSWLPHPVEYQYCSILGQCFYFDLRFINFKARKIQFVLYILKSETTSSHSQLLQFFKHLTHSPVQLSSNRALLRTSQSSKSLAKVTINNCLHGHIISTPGKVIPTD